MRRIGIPLLALVTATGSAWAESLVVNGSFEQAPATGRFLNLAAGATSLTGWVVTGEGIDLVAAAYWVSSEGAYSIDLDGSRRSAATPPFARGGVAQTFATRPGACYRVSFAMAGNPVRPPPVKPMRVSAAGQTAEFTFDITGKTGRNMGWDRRTWTFTAAGDTTTLAFESLTESPLTGYGPAIDDVSVVEVPCGEALEVVETDEEIQVQLAAEVLFDTGKYNLKPAATEALRKVARLLNEHAGLPVLIEGHTDSVGKPQANQALSDNRANAVKAWLVAEGGVAGDRITTRGLGHTQPVAGNDTAEGRQKNRRVEIRLRKQPAGGED